MLPSSALLDACLRFAGDVSPEVVGAVVQCLEAGDVKSSDWMLSGDAAFAFGAIKGAWVTECPGMPPHEVALILSAALRAITSERTARRVELVWSGPAGVRSTLRSTEPALLELLNGARESVYLVAFAAYKVPAVAAAISAALIRGVRVVFVLESEESSAGKVSFNPLAYLGGVQQSSVEVYEWPLEKRERDARGKHGTLHAKFAVADKTRLLVSSANLTAYAFDLNIELGVMVSGGDAAQQAVEHIDDLILAGVLQATA
jgi:cardiolipin synthase